MQTHSSSMTQKDDRRLYPRKECHLNDRKNQIIRNISFRGICLESDFDYSAGDKLDLDFRLPTGEAVHADGEVVRVIAGDQADRRIYGCALKQLTVRPELMGVSFPPPADRQIEMQSLSDKDYHLIEASLLGIQPQDVIVDFGSGRGHVLDYLEGHPASRFGKLEMTVHLVDVDPEALDGAFERGEVFRTVHSGMVFQKHVMALELSRLLPFVRFYRGEYSSLEEMKGRVEGLPDEVLDRWKSIYTPALHRILRGKLLTDADLEILEQTFSPADRLLAIEFGQASKLARESIEAGTCEELWQEMDFEMIHLGRAPGNFRYPFSAESADKILCSDVLSLIFNPQEVVCEMFRILRPGGTLVISQFPRDLTSRNVDSQACHMFSGEELNEMLVLAGFHDVNLVKKLRVSEPVVLCSAKK